ncbi:hypothetical protein Y032_0271g908 [Ancylostoma ceylanicum]|uniref:Uncharacterized protein n=1 Tax=Ancylostoma ceylanicum TaxID=53326 RepID=A0A016S8G7_9BILA|nr:hypothetical protein Y032_0271g908 [Ancylostoma ceylanicum]
MRNLIPLSMISDKMSEGLQQKEISTIWLRSKRHRDKKIRKDRSSYSGGPQQLFGRAAARNTAAVRKELTCRFFRFSAAVLPKICLTYRYDNVTCG